MGLEAKCTARYKGKESEGRAHCGDGEVSFRGAFGLTWKWVDLAGTRAKDGVLVLKRKEETAQLDLGDRAEEWLYAIKNPKNRLDKLGVKPGLRYAANGEFDDLFADELLARAGKPSRTNLDIVFVRLDAKKDLPKIGKAREQIVQDGMVWAVWPKGRKEFREDDVRDFALANGLVDVKVASFSDTLSALKLVIPVKLRKK
ncbi:MAG TPA: hypothetical protein VNI20_02600 [Fimbriimonadaceae bacterium]|nr:hypothetical protein [Fimbriimonadaceae bacterium]